MSKSHLIHQDKLRKRKRRKIMLRSLGFLFFVVILWCAVSFFSFADSLSIDRFVAVGAKQESEASIVAFAEDSLSKNVFVFFSGRNAFLLRRDEFEEEVKDAFSIIKEVKVSLDGFQTMEIHITEREPKAIWCDDRCFLIDETGLAFMNTEGEIISDLFFFSGGTGSSTLPFRFVPEEDFRELFFFARELGRMGFMPSEVRLLSDIEARFAYQNGGEIIIDPSNNPSAVLARIDALRKDKDIRFGSPEFMEKLLYADMRYGNKVVYKFR